MKPLVSVVFLIGLMFQQAIAEEHKVLASFPEGYLNPADICLKDDDHADNYTPIQIAQTDGSYVTVDQLIDAGATNPTEMFRFEPEFVKIAPGDSIEFANSYGPHTVHSIDGMAPEGTETFAIANRGKAKISFDKPGIYGIRCKVHSRYGMVMLVQVGDDVHNLEQSKSVKHGRWATEKFEKLFKLVTVSN